MQKSELIPGKIYTLYEENMYEDNKKGRTKKRVGKDYKLIKKYPAHALFENRYGIKRCIQYWSINRMLKN